MWLGNTFSHVCLSVCLSCSDGNFASLDLEIWFWVCRYIFRMCRSRSSGQFQGHRSKQECHCILFGLLVFNGLTYKRSFWYTGLSSEYLGQGRVSRSRSYEPNWRQVRGWSVLDRKTILWCYFSYKLVKMLSVCVCVWMLTRVAQIVLIAKSVTFGYLCGIAELLV